MRPLLCLSLLAACSDGKDEGTTPGTDDQAFTVSFDATVGGESAVCGGVYATSAGSVTVNDFRFYVSNVSLVASDGTEVPLALDDDGEWQGNNVALLDFEDATAGCAVGTPGENRSLRGTAPAGSYDGIAFDLGVPFELNHDDVALAQPPLNVTGMFWSWQGGYKFLRIDLVNGDAAPWNIHLGSTMCVSNGPSEAPNVECSNANRPRITLRGFDPTAGTVNIDLDALLAGADTALESAGSPPGCMSNPMDVDECPALFTNLGMDFATGDCVDGCDNQSTFSPE